MNHHPGKMLSTCLFESCSHQEFRPILHSLRFLTLASPSCAVHSGHKLDTTFCFGLPFNTSGRQRFLSPVIAVLPDLTKRYKPVFTRLVVVNRIASAGLVSTRTVTILAP